MESKDRLKFEVLGKRITNEDTKKLLRHIVAYWDVCEEEGGENPDLKDEHTNDCGEFFDHNHLYNLFELFGWIENNDMKLTLVWVLAKVLEMISGELSNEN